jgi:Domain of unknown function (DUF1906)
LPVTDIRRRSPLNAIVLATAVLLATALAAAALAGPAAARTPRATAAHAVRYHGYSVRVPAGWPVYRLTAGSRTCVRFDRHAVYLGTPGAVQRCPTNPLGRTEAILVSPQAHAQASPGANLLPTANAAAQRAGRSAARIVDPAHHVVVTATWNHDPGVIRRALSVRSLRSAGATFTIRRAAAPSARRRASARDRALLGTAAAKQSTPGGQFTGLGFDSCETPSANQMSDWLKSPFRAAGVYIGGTNMACSQPNLTSSWVSAQTESGWHIIPIYVGLQAPANSCGCAGISTGSAASQGVAAATDAVTRAEAIGIGPGNPIYDDMEAYNRTTANTTAVLAFLGGWTSELHADGYVSGVYSSDGSGIKDLVARYGTSFAEPDDLWVANWNGQQSTTDANVPAADWADHQRLHQYRGAHTDNYGGASINVDSDYVDAATAAAGTGAPVAGEPSPSPSLTVKPMPNGTLQVKPSWRGESGIASWQLEGGSSPTALTPIGKHVRASRSAPIGVRNSYAYYEVLALDSDGHTVGTSEPVATPAHVAMFGKSAYVPRRGQGGVPVACFELTSCRIVLKIRDGKRTVRNVKPQSVAAGGGVAHFKLSGYWHKFVAQHPSLPVTITVKSAGAGRISQAMHLVPYTTSGRRPRQSSIPSTQIKLVGGMEFVSHRGSGGVLAACVATAPCKASTTVSARGKVVGRSGTQTLGAGMVGYMHFSLTPQGRTLLARTKSNQLGVRVQISSQGGTADGASASAISVASGHVTLAAF